MRATSKLLAVALTAALQPAVASTVSVNFEDLTSVTKLTDQYATAGITFTGDAWGVTSLFNGCSGEVQFFRTGSCGALELASNAAGGAGTVPSSFTLSFAEGFVTEFSFVYSARTNSGVMIELLDRGGSVIDYLDTLTTSGCSLGGVRFCNWNNGVIQFDGVAYGLRVSGADQGLVLDDLKFIRQDTGPAPLPEPASFALAFGALAAAGWARKRNAR